MALFLQHDNNSGLKTDVSNIVPIGENRIIAITNDQYIDTLTGLFKTSLMPPLVITNVYVVASITDRNNISPVQTGDIAIVTDPPKETYIYNGSTWIEILSTQSLETLSDVDFLGQPPVDNEILVYTAGVWTKTSEPLFTNIGLLPGGIIAQAGLIQYNNDDFIFSDGVTNINLTNLYTKSHEHNNLAYLNIINQSLGTTSSPQFDNIVFTTGGIFTTNDYTIAFSRGIGDACYELFSTVGDYSVSYGTRVNDVNYAPLIVLNITTGQINCWYLIVNTYINSKLFILPNNNDALPVAGSFKYYNNAFIFKDSIGEISLRTLQTNMHVHSNLVQLETINQNLSTTSLVSFGKVTTPLVNYTDAIFNQTIGNFGYSSGSFLCYDSFGLIDLRILKDVSHVHLNKTNYLDPINQVLATTSSPVFAGIKTTINSSTTNGRSISFTRSDPTFGCYVTQLSSDYLLDFGICNYDSGTNTQFGVRLDPYRGKLVLRNNEGTVTVIQVLDTDLVFRDTSDITRFGMDFVNSIFTSPYISINTAGTLAYNLTVGGTQGSNSSTTFTLISDQNLKRDISPCPSGILEAFENIKIVDYKHKYSNEIKRGVLAQDIQQCACFSSCVGCVPEYKYTDIETKQEVIVNDMLDVNIDKIVFSSFEAIRLIILQNKDLQAQLTQQQTTITDQQTTITSLNERLNAIEAILFV